MADNIYNCGVYEEVTAVSTAKDAINGTYATIPADDVFDMNTAVHYLAQHAAIKTLMENYQKAMAKELEDIYATLETLRGVDDKIISDIQGGKT